MNHLLGKITHTKTKAAFVTQANALDSASTQRQAKHVLVNSAPASPMDSTTGLLQGKRVGDKFYHANGDVLQANHNAALNSFL